MRKPFGSVDLALTSELGCKGGIESDTGTHGCAEGERLDVLTLRACRLCSENGTEASLEVLDQLLVGEVDLSEAHMNDTSFVGSVLNTGCSLDFLNGGCNVVGDGSVSLVRGLGSEGSTDLTDLRGHVFGCQDDIKILESALDLRDQVVSSDDVCACLLSISSCISLCKDGNGSLLTSSVWKLGEAADVLVALSRINAEDDCHVDGLDKLCISGLLDLGEGFFNGKESVFVDGSGDGHIAWRVQVLFNVLSQWNHLVVQAARRPPTYWNIYCTLRRNLASFGIGASCGPLVGKAE